MHGLAKRHDRSRNLIRIWVETYQAAALDEDVVAADLLHGNHDQPIFQDLAKAASIDGPDRLWVADIASVTLIGGFVYAAVILDAWSRRVVGVALSRAIDVRLTLAALGMAIEARKPAKGCIHPSDRGSHDAAKTSRDQLAKHGLAGSTGRRGNPYDTAKAESIMTTLKIEGVYPMAFGTFADVLESLPRFIEETDKTRRLPSALGYLGPARFEERQTRLTVKPAT